MLLIVQTIAAIVPGQWCLFEEVEEVKLEGMSFDVGLDQEKAVCRFIMANGDEHRKKTYGCLLSLSHLPNLSLSLSLSLKLWILHVYVIMK